MSRRAAIFTQTDLDRATKAAAKVGYVVEIRPGGVIRIAPNSDVAENSAVSLDEESAAWDRAIAS